MRSERCIEPLSCLQCLPEHLIRLTHVGVDRLSRRRPRQVNLPAAVCQNLIIAHNGGLMLCTVANYD